MGEVLLSISDLRKSFGSHDVLCGVDFSMQRGEVVGLVGENGAGKSTLMRCVIGALRYGGGISVCGHDMAVERTEGLKHIGYLPESNPLYGELYIGEYLRYVAGFYGIESDVVAQRGAELIARLSLEPYVGKRIGTLSKGTRQRVGLAATLIHNPDILILDEPTTGLDPKQLEEFHGIVHDLAADHAVLFSTHIMQEIGSVCSRTVLLKNGSLTAFDISEGI